MKALDIAFKDLLRAFKTPFVLIMMFGAPLLITGLLYLAFGSLAGGGDLDLQTVRVLVANLDRPGAQSGGFAAGEMLVEFLQSEDLGDMLEVTLAGSEAAARKAVEEQQADVALIIPHDFTAASLASGREATVVQYEDPTLTIGPGIVEDLVSQFIDGFAGAKIAAGVVSKQLAADETVAQEAALAYAAWLESSGHGHGDETTPSVNSRSPAGVGESAGEGTATIGAIMIAMTIFFAFFMGANSAESIIREDEEGTLERLFTTPTSQAIILGGKFLTVVLTLIVQVVVLLLASGLIFGIKWGQPLTVFLVTLGLIVVAAGFGVLLMSFVKNTRQTGPVMGGVLTLTGMLGGLFTSGVPNIPEAFDTVRLVMPQGWAMYGWELALQGSGAGGVLLPVGVMLGLGALFFAVGVILFRKRFA
ncbi:MAG: ABC transporter permease [Anaerolineae bacterium]|jgi:ABC-2 type transport system permease protein